MNRESRKKATKVLEDTEQALRELVSEAALERQYDDVAWLVDLAKRISEMPRDQAALIDEVCDRTIPQSDMADRKSKSTARATMQRKKGVYPKFRTESDRLVKIGWSKKNKAEYEHRAPKEVVERIFAAVSKFGPGDSFDVDAVYPQLGDEGSTVPSYQIYMAIGWLRDIGILEKCGRNDYALSVQKQVNGLEGCWQQNASHCKVQ